MCFGNGEAPMLIFRKDGDIVSNQTKLTFPKIDIPAEILRITPSKFYISRLAIPLEITMGTRFQYALTIQNLTFHVAELVALIEASDGFVFSGYKQSCFRILPLSSHTLTLNVLPLFQGEFHLPGVKVFKRSDVSDLTAIVMDSKLAAKSFLVSHGNYVGNQLSVKVY
jgi:hypothetical protein